MSANDSLERAVFCRRLEVLERYADPWGRLYFGHEFCQRLLPSRAELAAAMQAAAQRKAAFTLVTPFVTNAGLARVRELIDAAAAERDALRVEIVVNDWGVLHWTHREHGGLPLALGRLLTKQKRGPRILRLAGRLPSAAADHFRKSNVDAPHVREFLEQNSVQRVELDNLLQGLKRENGLPASLYTPYGYVSTTRLCLLMRGDRPGKNLRSIGTCSRECRLYDVELRHPDMPVPLLVKGNTQFYRNDRLPQDAAALNIDRLVSLPEIPV